MKIYFINDLHVNFWVDRHKPEQYEPFFKEYFLPADVCCIAGDIANDYADTIGFLKFLKTKYKHIVYVLGNHDHGIFERDRYVDNMKTSYAKMARIAHEIDGNLDGNVIDIDGIKFGGACGASDWSYCYKNFETSYDEFFNHYQTWFDCRWWRKNNVEPVSLFNEEYTKIKNAANQKPNIFITHFQPLTVPTADCYKNDLYTGFFNYDDSEIKTILKPGTIYHYGHTHSRFKKEINGILYLNNCVGYPEEIVLEAFGKFKKEDFLIEV